MQVQVAHPALPLSGAQWTLQVPHSRRQHSRQQLGATRRLRVDVFFGRQKVDHNNDHPIVIAHHAMRANNPNVASMINTSAPDRDTSNTL